MKFSYRPLVSAWLLVAALALVGCSTLREGYVAPLSRTFDKPLETTLGRAHAEQEKRFAGQSGFRLLNNGVSALLSRAALIDAAERSIDLQYYIFDADEVGLFLLDRLLSAADRGVRVRIILDDYLIGFDDTMLSRIDTHPNVEVRIFNPYPNRYLSRTVQMLTNADALGRRMHNKIFVVDGQMGVVGGRNISSHYFEADAGSNFRDVDIMVTGPVMRDAATIFDSFWNDPIVVPVAAFGSFKSESDDVLIAWRLRTAEYGPKEEYARRKSEFLARVLGQEGLIWAKAKAVGEPPVRHAKGAPRPSSEVARAHAIARQNAQREVLYVTAYFVPGERGVELLSAMAKRGMKVQVMTNSLAATDVVAVHSGYAPYREALLSGGVQLYEYRPDAQRPEPKGHRLRIGSSHSALHAKVAIYDRQLAWVGSANFDPRSRRLNTEAGMMIESPELSERILSTLERDLGPTHSWRLVLDAQAPAGQRLVWHGERDGKAWSSNREPDANRWLQMQVDFYRLLGIEHLL